MQNSVSFALKARSFDKANPNDVHAKLLLLSATRSALDVEIGEWLLAAKALDLHEAWGNASFEEYALRMFGWDGRSVRERIRVATKLETLPLLRDELLEGRMVWSVAREISRIAESREIEREWIEKTKAKTAKEVAEMVRGLPPDSRPGAKKDPALLTHRRVFELTSEELAILDGFLEAQRKSIGESLDDSKALISGILAGGRGPGKAGRSPHQIAFVKRVGSEETYVSTSEGPMLIPPEDAERIECDALTVPPTVDGKIAKKASQSIPPSHRRQLMAECGGLCEAPGCRHPMHDLHHSRFRKDGGTHEMKLLLALCWYHHQRVHKGFLRIEGDREAGFRFFQANGRRYGSMSGSPTTLAAIADAVEGLNRLGSKDTDARRMAEDAAAELAAEGARISAEAVLERSLRIRGRVYKMKPVAHVSHTNETNPPAATAAPATDGARGLEYPAVAHVSHVEALERDAISGLRNLFVPETEARASVTAALALLRASGVEPTVERLVTEALRSRGQSFLAREAAGGESFTGGGDVAYRVRAFRPPRRGPRVPRGRVWRERHRGEWGWILPWNADSVVISDWLGSSLWVGGRHRGRRRIFLTRREPVARLPEHLDLGRRAQPPGDRVRERDQLDGGQVHPAQEGHRGHHPPP